MASWREMAAAAMSDPASASPRPAVADDGLPPDLREGIARLGFRRPPKISIPGVWPEIVSDAAYLAREGWAMKALALGWRAHDLFGVGPDDSDQFESLAVWLDGRKVAAMTEWKAMTDCGAMFFRDEYGRPTTPKFRPVFLWDWKVGR